MNAMKEYQIQDQKSAEFIQWFAKHQEHFCQTIVVEVTHDSNLSYYDIKVTGSKKWVGMFEMYISGFFRGIRFEKERH